MARLREWILRLLSVWRPRRNDRDLEDELRSHVLIAADAKARTGDRSAHEAARRTATLRAGALGPSLDAVRDQRGLPWLEQLLGDLRHAVRACRRNPGFTTVAIGSLALGIGVNAAMFSVVNAVLIQAVPLPGVDRLVRVARQTSGSELTMTEYDIVKANSQTLAAVAGYRGSGQRRLGPDAETEWIDAIAVTTEFLRTLGLPPALGREFTREETSPGGTPAIMLSDALWRRRFDRDPAIVGRTVSLDGRPATIVGVLPPEFWFPQPVDALVPLRTSGGLDDLGANTQVLARLKDGVDLPRAQSELAAMIETLKRAQADRVPASYQGLAIARYQDWLVGDVRTTLLLLFGATGLLLFVACGNLAALLVSRFAARRREFALRLALGSSQARIVTTLLVDNLVLAMAGATGGWLVARACVATFVSALPASLPGAPVIHLDPIVLTFTVVIALATAVVLAVLPVLATPRVRPQQWLVSGGRTAGAGGTHARVRNALLIGEIAMSTTLLVVAALLTRSVYELHREPLGFSPHGLVTFRTPLDTTPAASRAIVTHDWRDRLEVLPGVLGVATTSVLPLTGQRNLPAQRFGHPDQSIGGMEVRVVSPNYFALLGVPVREGRAFDNRDDGHTSPVAVINDALARAWWPSGGALHDRLRIGVYQDRTFVDDAPRDVVGIVGDTKTVTLQAPTRPTVFIAAAQAETGVLSSASPNWIVRVAQPDLFAAQIRSTMATIAPGQRVLGIQTMERIVDTHVAGTRFNASLFGTFAVAAVAFVGIGLYGVVAYAVSQRTREIGVRMALGARRASVLVLVLRQSIVLVAIGLGLGLGSAAAISRYLSKLLFGLTALDWPTFASVAALFVLVAIAAVCVPARRATTVDPVVALRAE
jgi:putative ABC transport system permease protein